MSDVYRIRLRAGEDIQQGLDKYMGTIIFRTEQPSTWSSLAVAASASAKDPKP